MAEIPRRIVVEEIVGNIEGRGDLPEGVSGQFDGRRQDIPRLDAAGKDLAHGRVADLRTEAHKNFVSDRAGIAHERVVADERTQAVPRTAS